MTRFFKEEREKKKKPRKPKQTGKFEKDVAN